MRAGSRQYLWYIVPVALLAGVLAVGAVVVTSLDGTGSSPQAARAAEEKLSRSLAPHWIVKRGQTFSSIAQRTGLSIEQLQTFNPRADPTTLLPGQRIKLRRHVPPPAPKPKGPRFWTVRRGQSFGSIAAATGRGIDALRRLNPRLKPTALQPGDRVRLRR